MSTHDTRKLPEGFDIIIARLDSFEQNMTARMDSLEQSVNSRMDSFELRLTEIEDKVDVRLKETRPVWEAVLAQIGEVHTEVQDTNHRMRALNNHVLDLAGRQERTEERVDKLERQPS